ncbi:DNA-binding anti-repressor SinI [Lederbergia lenta]|nr:DNA-binding anti-repressor SinI [Lederbergia lenta]MCM3109959.1 anti-repressor SinI family protein [Lederbergia lenta]
MKDKTLENEEWKKLILEARNMGLNVEEIKKFLTEKASFKEND